ncbi:MULTISPECIES: hypothetical protein [unclassified Flavobacterium]|uniref:hypothetical protein n=1 Tax=unclassified Flavobacterium TaxID=196869 RepID=UPI003F92AF5E
MKEKKNIDRLFQEQLKDFETLPNEKVWLNIAAELKKDKKKRRIVPLWFRYSGIAAALVVGILMLNNIDSNPAGNKEIIVFDSKNPDAPSSKKKLQEDQLIFKQKIQTGTTNPINSTQNEKENTTIVAAKKQSQQTKNQTNSTIYIAKNNSPLNPATAGQLSSLNPDTIIKKEDGSHSTNSVAASNSATTVTKNYEYTTKQVEEIAANDSKVNAEKTLKNSNELEEILKNKNKDEPTVAAVSAKKWQITTSIAPIYLNPNSGGSPIDSKLSDNDKTADKNISLGIGVHYAINNKITLRTGINKLEMGYNTNDVYYSPGFASNSLANIEYHSASAIEVRTSSVYNSLTSSEKDIQLNELGNINQKMGYYELPLEISYALLDKKVGISLIGGFSTLLLDENKISVVSSQSNIALGEASNLNKVHISSNFGVGFKYQFMKSFQFNFEPMLKYQFDTFSKEDNNFQPLFIGLYSGVSFQF